MSERDTQARAGDAPGAEGDGTIDVAPLIEAHRTLVEAATRLYERALEASKRL